jgi:hypothetical protein
VTAGTSATLAAAYACPIDHAGVAGKSLEPTMTHASQHLQSPAGIAPFPGDFPMSANSAFAPAMTREEADWERRWQLEWDRRNVED